MAAGKYKTQPIVPEYRFVHIVEHDFVHRRTGQLASGDFRSEQDIAAKSIDCLVAAGIDQPSTRIVRHAVPRPLLKGGGICLLPRFFCQIEIAEQADQCREHPTRLPAKDFLDHCRR
jgi:hypothetical protein